MESSLAAHEAKNAVNGNNTICEEIDGASDLDLVNWEQLEQELVATKKRKADGSKLLNCMNLREEIRRQLAEDDAKKGSINTNGQLRKSKSGFLDETSSSESEIDELVEIPLTDGSSSTSTDDVDDDKEFYLNHEFSTKITLQKLSTVSRDSDLDESSTTLDAGYAPNGRATPTSQLVVRPLQSRPNLKTRIQNQKDLQICFLNELPAVQRISTCSSGRSSSESAQPLTSNIPEGPTMFRQDFWSPPAEPLSKTAVGTAMMPKSRSMFEMETEKQKLDKLLMTQFEDVEFQWKLEMRNKIQQMHQNIRLQMQRQRKRRKRFPITTKVERRKERESINHSFLRYKTACKSCGCNMTALHPERYPPPGCHYGICWFCTKSTNTIKHVQFPHGKTRLDRQFLSDLNIAYLQVILNDLHCQTETLNEELVRFLEQRDELHMEQDSKLVDIDDLSRRLQELWVVSSRRKDAAQSDARQDPNPSSAFFSRLKAQSLALSNDNAKEINHHPSPEPAVTTPTSLNGSLQNFRQRIKSLLH